MLAFQNILNILTLFLIRPYSVIDISMYSI